MAGEATVWIQLLGKFRLSVGRDTLHNPPSQVCSLLAYLALRPCTPVPRHEIIASLWPDSVESVARRRLRQAIWKLRKFLRPVDPNVTVEVTPAAVKLICARHAVDAVRFEDLVTLDGSKEAALREAVDLYQGGLLSDLADEWLERERFRWQTLYLRALKELVARLLARDAAADAFSYAQRMVSLDPLDEDAAYVFMKAAANVGQRAAALAQYDLLSRALLDDLGIGPSPHVSTLFHQILGQSSGIRDYTTTFDVQSNTDHASDLPTLVGRSTERAQLLNSLTRVSAGGQSTAVVIAGPAGVGKSRLADMVIGEARLRGLTVYTGRCSEVPDSPPYHPVVEALWPRFTSAATRDLSFPLTTLLTALRSAGPTRNSRRVDSVGTFDAALISESLLRLLPNTEEQPVLFVLEDVHRADPATRVWLGSLLKRLTDLRVGLLLTVRTGETSDQELFVSQLSELGADIMQLSPLDASNVRLLVAAILGTQNAPPVLSHLVWRHVGGNPLRVTEAIRLLKERALVRESEQGWVVDARVSGELEALTTYHVAALVQRRLALLPDQTRDVLSATAILGTDVSPEHLRRLLGLSEAKVIIHVEHLIHHRLLLNAGTSLQFPHEEVRKAILDQITPIRRRWLHARAAKLLTRFAPDRVEDLYWHYHGAVNLEGALSAATAAGDRAYSVGDCLSGITWYERGLAILSARLPPGGLKALLVLEFKLENALNGHGDRVRQLEVLQSVIIVCRSASRQEELCEALIRRSMCLTRMNRRDEALSEAHQAIDLARTLSDLHREARAYRAAGLAHEQYGDVEASKFLNRAMRLFRQLGAAADESVTMSELATCYERLGNANAALRALDRAAALAPHDDSVRALLAARRASALLWTGKWSETHATLQEALLLLRQLGNRMWEARSLRLLTDVYTIAGRYRDALSAAGRALRIAQQSNDAKVTTGTLNSLISGVYSRLGLLRRAKSAFDRVGQLIDSDSAYAYGAAYLDSLATVCLHAGKWEEAQEWGSRALAAGFRADREWYVSAETRLHLGHALLELHEWEPARQHLFAALTYHRSSAELPYQAFDAALLAMAAINLGNRLEAESYLRESIRAFHRIDLCPDTHLLLWLHGEVWNRLGARRQAARAFRAAYAELNRIAASLGGPLRRRFLSLPFQRRVLEAVGMAPLSALPANGAFVTRPAIAGAETRSSRARRQAVLQALSDPTGRPNRRTLAAAFGVTPRTITNDIAALRRAGHQIVTPKTVH